MLTRRISLLILCFAVGLLAFATLDYWHARNAPLPQRLERQWREDLERLEASHKLPAAWFDVGEVEVFGGTPETKDWLAKIKVPLYAKKKQGGHKLEVLVVVWEENGKDGVLVQYNLIDLKTKNMVFELGRTLILREKRTDAT